MIANVNPLNLETEYPQYRVRHEPGGTKRRSRSDDVALQTIPCLNGHIFAWSGRQLAASLDGQGGFANRLRKLGKVVQDGDDGITVVFDPARFSEVAKIMEPKQRRSKAC